jgi:hypothetical protein
VQLKWASKKAKEGRFLLKQGNQFGQIKETASLARGFLKNRKEKSREVRKKCEGDW